MSELSKLPSDPAALPPDLPLTSLVYTLEQLQQPNQECASLEGNGEMLPLLAPREICSGILETRPAQPHYCGAMTMVGFDESTGKAVYKRMWCNTYGCSKCGPRRYRRARKAIAAHAERLHLTKFCTLTLDPKKLSGYGCIRAHVKYLRECWRKLRIYFARRYGRAIDFISVVELHKSGVPHLHVLIGEWIEQAWMKETWSSLGGGQIVWVEAVSIRRVAAYLSKYITKEKLNELPALVRRFSASHGITLFGKPARKEDGCCWFMSRLPIDALRASVQAVEDEGFWVDQEGAQVLVWFVAEMLFAVGHSKSPTRQGRTIDGTAKA